MKVHPAADIFPIDDDTLAALSEDIKKHGQRVAVELWNGQIIDGRRRWRACEMAGIIAVTRVVEIDDPVAYVLSLNLHRRQLNPSQLSMVAGRARKFYDQQAKERQRDHGATAPGKKSLPANLPGVIPVDSRDAAGRAVGVSGKSVDHATRVLATAEPEVIAAVDAGRLAVSTAATFASDSREDQLRVLADTTKRNRVYKGKTEEPKSEKEPGESRGVGVRYGNEAIDCLKRIPKNDGLRKRGFQLVTDWIRHNK